MISYLSKHVVSRYCFSYRAPYPYEKFKKHSWFDSSDTQSLYFSHQLFQQKLQLILLKEIKSTRADTWQTWERRVGIQKSQPTTCIISISFMVDKTLVSLIHIRWVVIYPVHSVIQHYLNTYNSTRTVRRFGYRLTGRGSISIYKKKVTDL